MAQTVLITGARSGFGAALATAFADAGWNVAATMRTPEKAPAEFADRDGIFVTALDVTSPESISAAVAAATEHFGGDLDAVVNAAGYVVQGSVEEFTLDDLRAQFETNVIGTAAVIQGVLPGMRERKHGHIITFSSAAGVIGIPRMEAYVASKFAVEGMSEALSRSVAHFGIKVTTIEPGVFETELGEGATATRHPINAYDAANAQLPDMYDWTPGNLEEAAKAIVAVAGTEDAPLRLVVGHGLDDVRRFHRDRLAEWDRTESLTRPTLAAQG
ncbi:SDR family oxidoreductase [Brachybacterium sp. MASK1Z-5]|uniref:SDR family oxidoreductase n=1 Tax=Brachybacterium halotolerans TaxID=2795215 RepID=A0ABS1BEE3_9MICO|nr:SDR family oxidoreductase [Brachybacterium halotolerans]